MTVWTDASGAITSPPPDQRMIAGDVCLAAVATWLIMSSLVLASSALAGALDRRRLSAWDAEWRAAGQSWSGDCS